VLTPLRIVLMFVLVNIGWLMFRETDPAMLVRDLMLTPGTSSPFDRQMGLYLFLLSAVYSLPLWLHALWDGVGRRLVAETPWQRVDAPWRWAVLQGVTSGALFAVLLVFRSRTSLDFIYFQF
jgi:hypothetical protein